MAQSALGRFGALLVAVSFGQCSKSDTLPLITDGDSVRLLSVNTCPDGAASNMYDDSSWSTARLPLQNLPYDGACLRKEFDIGSSLDEYRWLDIRLTNGSQARLNAGKGITSAEEQGLDWISGAGQTSTAGSSNTQQPVVDYSLDLRLFPTLLQPKRNVMALAVPQMRQGVELTALLRRDDGYDSAYVKVVNGPYLVHPTLTSVQLQWETDRSAPSWVVVGGGQRYDGGWSVHHAVDVDSLVSGRLYSFYVATAEASALPESCAAITAATTDDQLGRYVERRNACQQLAAAVKPTVADLHTAAAGGTQLKLAVVGDTRSVDATAANAVLAAVAKESPDVIVHTGDLVASATEPYWHGFFTAAAPALAHTPIVPVIGEADVSPWADRFSQLFALDGSGPAARAYSVDLGVVHLALLDCTADAASQATWLDDDLTAAEAGGALHLYVVTHLGPWSSGHSGGNATALATFVPVLRAHHVEAVFSGHDNIYEHGVADGQSYFVTGGAGGTVDSLGSPKPTTILARAVPHYVIIDISGTSATVLAKDATGATFDSVVLAQ